MRLAVFFVAGVVLTVLMCWLLAFFVDPSGAEVQAASGVERGCRWSVTVGVRSGAFWAESLREMGANWSSHQATGAPDTPTSGDMVTAWASATPDAQREWLVLSYPRSVVPHRIRIYESYNPGAVDRVTIFDAGGQEHEVWRGQDPTMPGAAPGVFDIPLSTSITTSRVKIYIDSPRVRGWNEIDAVGLVDSDGQTLWASEADASSSYGQPPRGSAPYAQVWPLVPSWSDLGQPSESLRTGQTKQEQRMIEAFGWPMLAMWSRRDLSATSAGAGTPGFFSGSRPMRFPGGFSPVAMPGRVTPAGKLAPVLPFRPIGTGLVVDTLFYGLVAWMLRWAAVRPRRFFREVSRMRQGGCLKCGYQLNYDFAGGCPECGWRRSGAEPPPPRRTESPSA